MKLTGARLAATPDMDVLLLSLAQEALANGVRPACATASRTLDALQP